MLLKYAFLATANMFLECVCVCVFFLVGLSYLFLFFFFFLCKCVCVSVCMWVCAHMNHCCIPTLFQLLRATNQIHFKVVHSHQCGFTPSVLAVFSVFVINVTRKNIIKKQNAGAKGANGYKLAGEFTFLRA
jgi:hypothetical protein